MSHSFGGFHDAVNAARPSFTSRAVERWAGELRHLAALVADPGPQLVAPVGRQPLATRPRT